MATGNIDYVTKLAEERFRERYPEGHLDVFREGFIEGFQLGYQEAVGVRLLERAILIVIEARGLDIPEAVRERVEGCRDGDQLKVWLQQAVTVDRAEEIFA